MRIFLERKKRTTGRKSNRGKDEFLERNNDLVVTNYSDIKSPLWIRDGEQNYNGFYLRLVDEFNLNHEVNMPYSKRYNRTMEAMMAINKKYPRRFFEYSRPSLSSILPNVHLNFREELRSFFFDRDKLHKFLKKDFTSENIKVNGIEFSETFDNRIQVFFKKDSSIFKKINKLFSTQGLFNADEEILDEVSLIIGGSELQHPHSDHSRFLSCFLDPAKKKQFKKDIEKRKKGEEVNFDLDVGFELNRPKYNEVVSGRYGFSSILVDLSDDESGFLLSVPLCYASVKDDYATIKYGIKEETFRVRSTTKYVSQQNDAVLTMITIEIPFGCQFVGDFIHSGANNMSMLNKTELKQTINKLMNLVEIAEQKPVDYSTFFDVLYTIKKLSKFSRFFCKTLPKNNPLNLSYLNVLLMAKDECDYVDDETAFQLNAAQGGKNGDLIAEAMSTTECKTNKLIEEKGMKENVIKVKVIKAKVTKKPRPLTASMLRYSNGAYAAKSNAFEVYFEIEKYVASLKSLNDDKIDAFFPQLFETLSNKVHNSVFVCQKCVIVGVNKCEKDAVIGKNHYWTVDLRFFKWFSCEEKRVKRVKWLIVKESTITQGTKPTMGVFANRKFMKNEVIGLFSGQRIGFGRSTSKYAFRSKYGTYDPLRGFVGNGSSVYNMAMHIVVDPQDKTKVNAELSCDFLVRAKKNIHEGEEILLFR